MVPPPRTPILPSHPLLAQCPPLCRVSPLFGARNPVQSGQVGARRSPAGLIDWCGSVPSLGGGLEGKNILFQWCIFRLVPPTIVTFFSSADRHGPKALRDADGERVSRSAERRRGASGVSLLLPPRALRTEPSSSPLLPAATIL